MATAPARAMGTSPTFALESTLCRWTTHWKNLDQDLQVFKTMLVCNPSNDKVFQICLELFQSARVDRSLACPRLYLTRRCVLDATIATAPPTGFSQSWGHRMVTSSGQDLLLLGVADRPRLQSEYTLPHNHELGETSHAILSGVLMLRCHMYRVLVLGKQSEAM